MSDKPKAPPSVPAPKPETGNGKAPDGLRDRPVVGAPAKRGRPVGSTNKTQTPAPAAPAQAKSAEFVYSKVGKAFRAIFNIMAVKSNCDIWLLDPAEEKDLGESCGDILLDLGMADSTATKIVFAAGTVIAVGGSKAIGYAAYENARRGRLAPPKGPIAPAGPPPHQARPPAPPTAAPAVVAPKAGPTDPFADPLGMIHESKGGAI